MKGPTMSKLVLMVGISLDGLVARPGKFGSGGWGLPPEERRGYEYPRHRAAIPGNGRTSVGQVGPNVACACL